MKVTKKHLFQLKKMLVNTIVDLRVFYGAR